MFYPLFLELRNKPVLVVGGGPIAERKVESLLQTGASVTVVAPDVSPQLKKLASSGTIRTVQRKFQEADLENALLVISATGDTETQERVAALARAHGVLVNTVDQPRLCDFIVPAVVRRGDVIVAISTSGKSPALAAALKVRVENVVTKDAARAANVLGAIRTEVHARLTDPAQRKEVFERIVASGILDWISEHDDASAIQKALGFIEGLE
jgi:precorrin-2 dehydrogenase / sirohydrochlorin ferrochelatase